MGYTDAGSQRRDDSDVSDLRKYLYSKWAQARQPVVDSGKEMGVMDYVTSPWLAMKLGATELGADFGDLSVQGDGDATRDALLKARTRATQDKDQYTNKHDAFSAWDSMKDNGILRKPEY